MKRGSPYWLETKLLTGENKLPTENGICIIGSGLSGISTAYWLMEFGYEDITIVDFEPEKAASFRNCGHILYGTVESMHALVALWGRKKAHEIWSYSIEVCHEVRDTIKRLGCSVDYKQDGYLCIAIDKNEDNEIQSSIKLLNEFGFISYYKEPKEISALGFSSCQGGRFEPGSAQAHPVKFRNALLKAVLQKGARYHSTSEVASIEEQNDKVEVYFKGERNVSFDACVITTNAYSPLLSSFFASRKLIEPFRGQIITSQPLKKPLKLTYPHSFDHGYEYALFLAEERRLMIGGWRNHTPTGEIGTYDLNPSELVEQGLMTFVKNHYEIDEPINWSHSWAGIMASSKTALPFIGPTSCPRIFTCAGYTGHGFSWAHGSAKLLAKIIMGLDVPQIATYFNPIQ